MTISSDNVDGDGPSVLRTTLVGDGVIVFTTFVTDKFAWAVVIFTVSDACVREVSLLEDDTSTL